MKPKHILFGMLALFAASCANDEMNEVAGMKQNGIQVTAGLDANTRVGFEQDGDVTHAFWEEGDQITLYAPSQGALNYQVSTLGEGGYSATFAATDNALQNTDETIYAAHRADMEADIADGMATLPNTDTWTDEHPLPFAYAISNVADGKINLSFQHIFAYLKLTLNAETVASSTNKSIAVIGVSTTSDEPLANVYGYFNIPEQEYVIEKGSNHMFFTLEEVFTATGTAEKSVYIPILPQPAGETITINIFGDYEANDILFTESKEVPSTGFVAGRAYTYSPKSSITRVGNTITLTEAGTLSQAISAAEKDTITSLKIIGPLNGDDIRFIREMAGSSYSDLNTTNYEAKLIKLDLSETTIVAGGSPYFVNYDGSFSYSLEENDVIPQEAFACSILEELNLPNSIKILREGAIDRCKSLTTITVPEGVTEIQATAFNGCSGLTTIELPSTLDSIGNFAFGSCSNLVSCDIPSGLRAIGSNPWTSCNKMIEFVVANNDYFSTEGGVLYSADKSILYLCLPGVQSVSIPSFVTTIADWAFAYCTLLTEIILPDNVSSIGSFAFHACTSLTTFTFPESITKIPYGCFGYCINLEEVNYSDKLTEFGTTCFSQCYKLKSIVLPDGVTSFASCLSENTSLETIYSYSVEPPYVVFPDGEMTNVTVYVPAGCKEVYQNAVGWRGTTFKDIVEMTDALGSYENGVATVVTAGTLSSLIPEDEKYTITTLKIVGPLNGDDIRFIREMAGRDVDGVATEGKLVDLDMSEASIVEGGDAYYSFTSRHTENNVIGPYMFYGTILKNILLPNNAVSIGWETFNDCTSLTSITIPDGVTSIGKTAFADCSSLPSITIPEGVTLISDEAFWGCSSLTSITLPDGITSIGESAFQNCSSLTSISLPDGLLSIDSYGFSGCISLESIILPNGLTSLGERVFRNCSALNSIIIPDAVTSIGASAFTGCTSLTTVTLSSAITSIAVETFYNCSSLTSISIPKGVTSIGTTAFRGCSALTSISIPDAVITIGNSAFEGCSLLTSVTLGSGITSIGKEAFYNCKSLTSIIIPDGITTIGDSAFESCIELSSVTIGSGITAINESTFEGCSSLVSINIPDGVISIGEFSFYGCSLLENVTISSQSALTSIGRRAFMDCSSLASINIPEGVTSIDERTFGGCSSLVSINIPDGVTSIGDYAFYECSSLASIYIPNGVTEIRDFVFNGCSSLVSINIPDGVTSIGDYAFYECSALTSINIPDSLSSIGEYAFSFCSMATIVLPSGITSIGKCAFLWCSSLAEATCNATIPPILGTDAFNGTITTTLFVPSGCATAYSESDWAQYFTTIEEM